jgi:Transposase DNA-binding/Transposase Tn5 dimerisation domain
MSNESILEDEFEQADFCDSRLNKRAKKILNKLYAGIGKSLPNALQTKTELEAAYRFFNNDSVTPELILQPHIQATIGRIKQHSFVAFIQDSSDVDVSHMESVENLGVLSDTKKPGCAFHSMIACTRERLNLGVVAHEFLFRDPNELGVKKHNNQRNIEEKESYRWIEFYNKAMEVAKQAPNTEFVCITDREGDIFELFFNAKQNKNRVNLLVRSQHNRNVEIIESEKILSKNLDSVINETGISYHIEFNLPAQKKRISLGKKIKRRLKDSERTIKTKSRLVKQSVKVAKISLKAPKHKMELGKIDVNVIHLEEINSPEVVEPIVWTLLTTLDVSTEEKINEIIQLYLSRWTIEVFFYVLKKGCKIEELRFENGAPLCACIVLYMIVAWRLMFIMFLGRNCPELPCSIIFEEDEWKSVYATVKRCRPPDEAPPLGEFVLILATLGGYLKRKGCAGPGVKVMWQAIQMLTGCAIGWAAYRDFGK